MNNNCFFFVLKDTVLYNTYIIRLHSTDASFQLNLASAAMVTESEMKLKLVGV